MDESLKGGGCISASISGWELEVSDWLMKEKVTFGRQKTLGTVADTAITPSAWPH